MNKGLIPITGPPAQLQPGDDLGELGTQRIPGAAWNTVAGLAKRAMTASVG